jgi:hypothetical protein
MPLIAFYNPIALLVFFGALLLSVLLYLKNIREKIVAIGNLCSLLVVLVSIIYLIHVLGRGIEDPAESTLMLGATILMNLYAVLGNVAARVWVRINELTGSKRLRIRIHAEIVERKSAVGSR